MKVAPLRDDLPFLGRVEAPAGLRAPADAASWAAEQAGPLRAALHRFGALLFRDLPLRTPADFSAFYCAQEPHSLGYTGGFTVREPVAPQVYTSTSAPPFISIPLHTEMAYAPAPPDRVYLFCQTPAARGGQTPIADGRSVLRRADPALVARLRARGLCYIRNLRPEPGKIWPPTGWKKAYHAETPAEAEAAARASGAEVQWFGEELRVRQRGPLTATHPVTGEEAWFNQLHNFHHSNSAELFHAGVYHAWALFRWIEARERWGRAEDRLSIAVTDGEGAPIRRAEALGVRRAIWAEARTFDWQPGDVLLLDNRLVLHGRAPFKGTRQVFAALARDQAAGR